MVLYLFKQEKRVIKTKKNDNFIHYYFKSSNGVTRSGQLTNEQLVKYVSRQETLNYPSLDHFIVENQAYCSCTTYFKYNICKHIVSICSMRNIYKNITIQKYLLLNASKRPAVEPESETEPETVPEQPKKKAKKNKPSKIHLFALQKDLLNNEFYIFLLFFLLT